MDTVDPLHKCQGQQISQWGKLSAVFLWELQQEESKQVVPKRKKIRGVDGIFKGLSGTIVCDI